MRQDARKLFAANLKRLLTGEGLSNSGLARHLNVQPQMVSRWLQGKILPTKHLEGIAEYLGAEISELFVVTSERPKVRAISQEEALDALARSLGFSIRKIKS